MPIYAGFAGFCPRYSPADRTGSPEEQKSTESPVLSPSINAQDNSERTQQEPQTGGEQQPLQDLLQATEEEMPPSMGKQLSDMISGQCSPKQRKGMSVAVEGKLSTTELPDALIMEAQAISRALRKNFKAFCNPKYCGVPGLHGMENYVGMVSTELPSMILGCS